MSLKNKQMRTAQISYEHPLLTQQILRIQLCSKTDQQSMMILVASLKQKNEERCHNYVNNQAVITYLQTHEQCDDPEVAQLISKVRTLEVSN